jgi:hypothetical protein
LPDKLLPSPDAKYCTIKTLRSVRHPEPWNYPYKEERIQTNQCLLVIQLPARWQKRKSFASRNETHLHRGH